MRTIFILLTTLCVLGLAASWVDAGGPAYVGHGYHNAPQALHAGYPYHGGHPVYYGGYHGGYHAYRPYPARVYAPVYGYPVYRYPGCYYYPNTNFYYSTPRFSIGIGF